MVEAIGAEFAGKRPAFKEDAMRKLILPLFFAILFSPAALRGKAFVHRHCGSKHGDGAGGFVVGECTHYKTGKGAKQIFEKVTSTCKEDSACTIVVDGKKTCEAGECEWAIKKLISVEAK
jgi:hypothetical protein